MSKFMDHVEKKKYQDAKAEFNTAISAKIKDRIQDIKKEVALDIFKDKNEDV